MQVRPEPSRVKHLLGAHVQDRLKALPTNIRLGCKGLPRTNTLAYCEHSSIPSSKSFMKLVLNSKPISASLSFLSGAIKQIHPKGIYYKTFLPNQLELSYSRRVRLAQQTISAQVSYLIARLNLHLKITNWTSLYRPRLGQVRLGQVRLDQVRLGQVRLGQVRLGQVRLGQVRLGQVRPSIAPKYQTVVEMAGSQ